MATIETTFIRITTKIVTMLRKQGSLKKRKCVGQEKYKRVKTVQATRSISMRSRIQLDKLIILNQ
jgi:hypothetical protein